MEELNVEVLAEIPIRREKNGSLKNWKFYDVIILLNLVNHQSEIINLKSSILNQCRLANKYKMERGSNGFSNAD